MNFTYLCVLSCRPVSSEEERGGYLNKLNLNHCIEKHVLYNQEKRTKSDRSIARTVFVFIYLFVQFE